MHKSLALIFLTASGCVTYESEKGAAIDTASRHEEPEAGSTGGENTGGEGTGGEGTGGEQADPADSLSFSPSEAEQGDIFAGVISAGEGFALDQVEDIYLLGDLEILDFLVYGDEIVVTLAVDGDADTGEVTLAIVMDDQTTYWLEGALTIYEAGSGSSTAGSSGGCP